MCLGLGFPFSDVEYNAGKTLSEQVTENDLSVGFVYPSTMKIRDISRKIAVALVKYVYEKNLAAPYSKPTK
ncbi:unnamed protein product [Rotaria sp. Silwood2]|nr:unnamed protein product [Rotaria sp. Silwood2]CAF2682036.1 unnamed protein product [Rotaria sp. Silwood2]CAF3035055.1 unnamed protein product [Rotaria sp. Silwood2]CAF4047853.1 unnamed protein product [Rotaria sp. Silwood2]CAF4439896.1 unnamed protein product [Rotaria sp. Silwood2]